jgi:hypothetical protein
VHLSRINADGPCVIDRDDLIVLYYFCAEFAYNRDTGKSVCTIKFSFATRASGSGKVNFVPDCSLPPLRRDAIETRIQQLHTTLRKDTKTNVLFTEKVDDTRLVSNGANAEKPRRGAVSLTTLNGMSDEQIEAQIAAVSAAVWT